MDKLQFASDASAPTWEEPGWRDDNVQEVCHVHHDVDGDNPDGDSEPPEDDSQARSDRRAALMEAASELNFLCASGAPLADVLALLSSWEDSSPSSVSPAANGRRIQPNALAWFSDTNAVQHACTREDMPLLRALLERGLLVTSREIAFAAGKWRETRGPWRQTFLLLVHFALHIHEPINRDSSFHLMSLLLDDVEAVRWCLSLGADPNASSPSGNTIMERAALCAPLDVLELLIVHGGIVRDSELVARAASASKYVNGESGRLEAIRLLLEHGAPVDAYFGETTTDWSISCLSVEIGRRNALHFAIGKGMTDLVQLLIEKGADTALTTCSAQDTKGLTVSTVELARMCAHEDIIRLLEPSEPVL